jgi:hypothetical protein
MKKTIIGKKGKTVCYQLNNFRFENSSICWDSFNFYTPTGTQFDGEGNAYFEVPSISELIERDEILNKEVLFKVTQTEGIEIIEILEGATPPSISIGIEGDIVCVIYVPTDPQESIQIEYKEVIDDG